MNKYILYGSGGVLTGVVVASLFQDGVREVAAPVRNEGEIFRLILTAFLLVANVYLAVRSQHEKGLQRTIEIQTGNLQELDRQNKIFKEELIIKDKELIELRGQIGVLMVKTDLSQVVTLISETNKQGEERYTRAIQIITEMIGELKVQALSNAKMIKDVAAIIDKRWKVGER
jgi:hypothetical protein